MACVIDELIEQGEGDTIIPLPQVNSGDAANLFLQILGCLQKGLWDWKLNERIANLQEEDTGDLQKVIKFGLMSFSC